jgi:hypothetical protein
MQLHIARLCLDCNEIHDQQSCPVCSSEEFAFLSRWVPATERRNHPRRTTSPEAEVYRELISPTPPRASTGRLLKGGAFGVAALAVAWLWRNAGRKDDGGGRPEKEEA